MSKLNPTRCDTCRLAKTPIVYLRMNQKLCTECWRASKETAKSLIDTLPNVKDTLAPLGYHFVVNDYFRDEKRGKRHADWVFDKMSVSSS